MYGVTAEWFNQAEYDLDTGQAMSDSERYIYTVFMCHLAVEKGLKALLIERFRETLPKSHNLIYLMNLSQAQLTGKSGKIS